MVYSKQLSLKNKNGTNKIFIQPNNYIIIINRKREKIKINNNNINIS